MENYLAQTLRTQAGKSFVATTVCIVRNGAVMLISIQSWTSKVLCLQSCAYHTPSMSASFPETWTFLEVGSSLYTPT